VRKACGLTATRSWGRSVEKWSPVMIETIGAENA